MKRMQTTLMIAGLLAIFAALPAAAELFTVELINGYSFETRYRPKVDPRDPDKAYVLTDQGNWIALQKTLIHDVISRTEARGFGKVIDTTTIDLGWAPNDTPIPDGDGGTTTDPRADFAAMLRERAASNPPVTTQQFVNPGQAGQGGGGLPVSSGGGFLP